MIEFKTGDLLTATEDVIAHQVNCCGAAGGLAAVVFDKWPDAANDYHQIVERVRGIGTQGADILLGGLTLTGQQNDGHMIANLFGQFYPGADYRPYALETALTRLADVARDQGWSVALPYRLSCGICGGDWSEVLEIIERSMHGVECVIYKREGDE